MPSQKVSKSKKTKSTRVSTRKPKTKKVAPVVEVAVVEAPVVEAPVVEAPVVEAPVVEAPVVEAPVVEADMKKQLVKTVAKSLAEDEDLKIDIEFNTTINSMKTLITDARGVLSSYKSLHKRVNKRLRVLNRKPKGKRKGGNQKTNPSGFNKPTEITDALATFLGVKQGSLLPRTDVTRKINSFIKEHDLQGMMKVDKHGIEKNDNRYINTSLPKSDKRYKWSNTLNNLLKPTENLSYFNLQTFLSPHFLKAVPKAAPAPVSA